MPELPDITVYVEALEAYTRGRVLEQVRLASPFLLRTVDPPLRAAHGCVVRAIRRQGKRIIFALETPSESGHRSADGRTGPGTQTLYLVLHLMIAGRLLWKEKAAKVPGKIGLAAFDFENGSLVLTEAGSKKRASLHLVASLEALAALDRGGIEPLEASIDAFREALVRENHTLKRALTDPRLFSGIGNAYSDEILHRARLSPMALTRRLAEEQIARLHVAVRSTLTDWTNRLRIEAGTKFPAKVTAFRDGMAAHGRYGKPCPDCGTAIQRIVYAENECNYCPRCQTGGKLLADRALSRLMHDDWPKTIDELEAGRG